MVTLGGALLWRRGHSTVRGHSLGSHTFSECMEASRARRGAAALWQCRGLTVGGRISPTWVETQSHKASEYVVRRPMPGSSHLLFDSSLQKQNRAKIVESECIS
jgi:hypothetical protein